MHISEVMTKNVVVLPPSATLQEAARRMREADTGFIPVEENGRLIGTVTDRDICVRGVADDRPASSTEIRSVLSETVVCCYDDEDHEAAANAMAEHKVRRLPVIDRQEKIVGVVSLGDLAVRAHAEKEVGEAMEKVAEPGDGAREV